MTPETGTENRANRTNKTVSREGSGGFDVWAGGVVRRGMLLETLVFSPSCYSHRDAAVELSQSFGMSIRTTLKSRSSSATAALRHTRTEIIPIQA